MEKFLEFDSLLSLIDTFKTDQDCRDLLEKMRWNNKPRCAHCRHDKVYKFKDGILWKCAKCRKQFTVKVGTIFEESNISLRKWFMAIYLLTNHKKGISSIQLGKDIRVTQKTAWFLNHRIRYAMSSGTLLKGIVEADETYVGGKAINRRYKEVKDKVPVLGLVERKGEVRTQPVIRPNLPSVRKFITENVNIKKSTLISDENPVYKSFKAIMPHNSINHQEGYAIGDIHTNTIEGFWSLLKRGIFGIYHHVSPQHLYRYCNEFEFRYNTRESKDNVRFLHMLSRVKNKRLKYKTLTNRDLK